MTRRLKHFAGILLAIWAAAGLSGCGAAQWVGEKVTSTVDADRVEVRATADSNNNSPVAVDIVLVYDPAVLDAVAALAAVDWFAKREQFKRDFPRGLEIFEFEVVPGTRVVKELSIVDRYKAYGGLVFLSYPGPGDHRIRFDKLKRVQLVLLSDRFELESEPE